MAADCCFAEQLSVGYRWIYRNDMILVGVLGLIAYIINK
tara:strand:+ start:122 stop:238 length:117 start_codon:yes stop_codon:yes gene_type:complete